MSWASTRWTVTDMRLARRTFLAGASSATLGALGPAYGGDRADGRDLFVSCAADRDGHYVITGIDGHGRVQFTTPLPARGHGIAGHPARAEIVVFARRPGAFAVVLQTTDGTIRRRIEAPSGEDPPPGTSPHRSTRNGAHTSTIASKTFRSATQSPRRWKRSASCTRMARP